MTTLLEFSKVSLNYKVGTNSLEVLKKINFKIKAGEIYALTGPSGSGKSSLLMLASGMERVSSGEIIVDSQNITKLSEDKITLIRRDKIGVIFQEFHLHPQMTSVENACLPLEFSGVVNAQKIALKYLSKLGLKERLHHYPSQLSGGEQQRVAIVRALANNQKIILADEPTGNLDQTNSELVLELLIKQVKQNNSAALIVTHDINLAQKCDKIISLLDGKLVSILSAESQNNRAEKQLLIS